jgi:hypothetical protein
LFVNHPADNLLAKKSNKHLLQDYDQRQAAAVGFMSLVRPSLSIAAGALTDPQVRSVTGMPCLMHVLYEFVTV